MTDHQTTMLIMTAAALGEPPMVDLASAAGLELLPHNPNNPNDGRAFVKLRHARHMESGAWWRSLSVAERAVLEAKARLVKARALIYAASSD